MQTILGSGEGIGIPLAKELNNFTKLIRLVSRNPKKVNDTDELFPLDVNDDLDEWTGSDYNFMKSFGYYLATIA